MAKGNTTVLISQWFHTSFRLDRVWAYYYYYSSAKTFISSYNL